MRIVEYSQGFAVFLQEASSFRRGLGKLLGPRKYVR